jgi:phosphinothricin acetyltransferase
VLIRRASHPDLEAITAIYNEVIANSDAVYRDSAVPVSERIAWFESKVSEGYPVVVVISEEQVIGYGVYGNFRFGEGYNSTVEHSVHVRFDNRGKGMGTAILSELINIAKSQDRHVMVAAIDSKNHGSIKLHEKLGFIESARMSQIAIKNGQLLTLVLMQKFLKNETPST